jgi:hypothetical protein
MPHPENPADPVGLASDAYDRVRAELRDALSGRDEDEFDRILSLTEEFGAKHVRALLQGETERLGVRLASTVFFDELEPKLQRYIDANSNLDRAVAAHEEFRIGRPGQPDTRTFAVHGEFPVIDMKAMTITFPGRAPEPVILVEGRGPEPLEPERGPVRARNRGRSR